MGRAFERSSQLEEFAPSVGTVGVEKERFTGKREAELLLEPGWSCILLWAAR